MAFVKFVLQAKREILLIMILGILNGGARAGLIGLISREITGYSETTWTFIGRLICLITAVLLAEWLTTKRIIDMGAKLTHRLQVGLGYQIIKSPLSWLEKTGFARVIAAVGGDVGTISLGVNQLPKLLVSAPVALGCTLYLVWLSPFAFGVLVFFLAPFIYVLYRLTLWARLIVRDTYEARDEQYHSFEELVLGNKELRLNYQRMFTFMKDQVVFNTDKHIAMQVKYRRFFALNLILSHGIYFLFVLAIFVLIVLDQVSLEVLTGYVVVALYMKSAVLALFGSIPFWVQANTALIKIESLGFSVAELVDKEHPTMLPAIDEFTATHPFKIELVQASHLYTREIDDTFFRLGPINLTFNSGEVVFIVGHNGSGKTTLLKLLIGLYFPETGQIRFDGKSIEAMTTQAYQNLFSAIFADFHLFTHLFGLTSAEQEEQANYYLKRFQLEHKVSIENGELSTVNLSAGQRKRLALLIAYVEDRPVMVFDEWAENQDPEFTRVFYEEILPDLRRRGKLVIVISHDDQYFSVADRLIELENGLAKEIPVPVKI